MSHVLAENDAEQDFQVEENIIQEEKVSGNSEDEYIEDTLSNSQEESKNDDNREKDMEESFDDVLEWQGDIKDEGQDLQKSSVDMQDDNNQEEEWQNEKLPVEIKNKGDEEGNNTQDPTTGNSEMHTWSDVNTWVDIWNWQENNQDNGEKNNQDWGEQNIQDGGKQNIQDDARGHSS